MSKQASLFLPLAANNQSVTLLPADTTTPKVCFTAAATDSDVKAIIATSNDTAAINLQLWICRGGVDYLLGTINVPIGAGNSSGVPAIDLLNAVNIAGLPLDYIGKRYIPMKTGDTLKVGCLVTITTAKTCYVSVLGQDY